MISVITPTHSSDFLDDAYQSLLKQTYTEWEWLIVPNGPCPTLNFRDKRVRVEHLPLDSENIGTIKRWSFERGRGDVLVELDRDDLLLPNALEEIAKAFEDKDVDFAYSNFAEFQWPGWGVRKQMFPEDGGWKVRMQKAMGHTVAEIVAPPPNASNVSWIYTAPNHVRAWRASFYKKIGGHADLWVCDDHELLIRTYLRGRMKHIDKLLYLYRVHGKNFWLQRNKEIQDLTLKLHREHLLSLVEREAAIRNLPLVDLGGAFRKLLGWLALDVRDAPGVDIVADANGRLPFEDNSVFAFRAVDFLEHIADKLHIIKEIYRCLVPGGWLLSCTPSTDGRGAFCDPTHVAFYNSVSFRYYFEPERAGFIGSPVRFLCHDLYDHVTNTNDNIIHTYFNAVALKCDYEKDNPTAGMPHN